MTFLILQNQEFLSPSGLHFFTSLRGIRIQILVFQKLPGLLFYLFPFPTDYKSRKKDRGTDYIFFT